MDGSRRRTRRAPCALGAVALVLAPATGMGSPPVESADSAVASARLRHPEERVAVIRGIQGAARRLADPECQELLSVFTDARGRPLREALEAEGLSVVGHLGRLFFYDGSTSLCGWRRLAYTEPGSHTVFVCGRRFRTVLQQNPTHAEAAIIHEALHTLGLGENPPTWEEITARVLGACRR
jgi:hypothetical protein